MAFRFRHHLTQLTCNLQSLASSRWPLLDASQPSYQRKPRHWPGLNVTSAEIFIPKCFWFLIFVAYRDAPEKILLTEASPCKPWKALWMLSCCSPSNQYYLYLWAFLDSSDVWALSGGSQGLLGPFWWARLNYVTILYLELFGNSPRYPKFGEQKRGKWDSFEGGRSQKPWKCADQNPTCPLILVPHSFEPITERMSALKIADFGVLSAMKYLLLVWAH